MTGTISNDLGQWSNVPYYMDPPNDSGSGSGDTDITRVYQKSFHEVGGFYAGLKEAGLEAVPIFMALAVASGTISADTLAALMSMLDEELDKAAPL